MVFSPTLLSRLQKARQLSRRDRGLLCQALVLLPLVHAALGLLGYSRLCRLIERLTPVAAIHGSTSECGCIRRSQEIARLVSIAARYGLYRASCLRRSLLFWWFLRRERLPGGICFGVRADSEGLQAHAWVECCGAVANDAPDVREQYHPLQEGLPATHLGL